MGAIFVGGVHGVGKTTCCEQVAQHLLFNHHRASSLIASEQQSAVSISSKLVKDVSGNQSHLVRAVEKLYATGHQKFILDGHFSIANTDGELDRVSIEIFSRLKVDGLVVFIDEPAHIYSRRMARDGHSPSMQEIDAHQCVELEHAVFISNSLKVSYHLLKALDAAALSQIVKQIWL